MKSKKKKHSLEAKRDAYGYTFVIHWIIGLVLFFIVPVFSSIFYGFSDMSIEASGIETTFIGIDHFKEILTVDPDYVNNIRDSFGTMLYAVPIILSLSLVLAVILNQKFVGRTVARAVFFLPVIIVTSSIMTVLDNPNICEPLFTMSTGSDASLSGEGLIDFNSILADWEMPAQITEFISKSLGNIFGLIWSCGVQTILFLAGLQSIPDSFYEVSKIEGANKWEEFWFITVPMIRNVLTLVIIYTLIEQLTLTSNPVMKQAYGLIDSKQIYDQSSAMMWFYFVIVIAVMGTVLMLYNRLCVKRWE